MADDVAMQDGTSRLLGFGHSHLSALLNAWKIRENLGKNGGREAQFVRLNHPRFQPNFEVKNRPRQLSSDLEKRIGHIIRSRAPDVVVCVLMGNEYNSMAMIRHPRPYDFAWPERGFAAEPEAEEIPFAMMKAQLEALASRNALLFWKVIAQAASCPLYLLPPPPPIASETHILAHPGKFGEMAVRYGVNRPEFRCKMWQLYCEVLREAVAGSATHFLELPEAVIDDGFLAEPYWSTDPTHANAAYGEILLAAIEERAFAPDTV